MGIFWSILIGLGIGFLGYKILKEATSQKERINGFVFLICGAFILVLGIWLNIDDDDYDTDEPEVTYMEDKGGTSYPNFGGDHYYVLHDANRICNSNKKSSDNNHFVITKKTPLINSADVCDRCGHRWYTHSKR